MPFYAAFLRGVMPMNCKMPELKKAFEKAGFADVRTVLGSGNVVFSTKKSAESALERQAEAAMQTHLGRSFLPFVRPIDVLRELLEEDPYKRVRLAPGSKRVVTFVRGKPTGKLTLPIEVDGARILALRDDAVLSAYVPGPKGPVFMTLIEKHFGKEQTTRTWETVVKVVKAAE